MNTKVIDSFTLMRCREFFGSLIGLIMGVLLQKEKTPLSCRLNHVALSNSVHRD